jgi:hypothetical protein
MTRKPRPKARTPLSGVSRTRWVHQEAQGARRTASTQGWIAAGWPGGAILPLGNTRERETRSGQRRKHARVDCGEKARGAIYPDREHAGARSARGGS